MSLLDVEMLEAGISAISHRLKAVETKLAKDGTFRDSFENGQLASVLATRLSPICDKIARIEAQMGLKGRFAVTEPLAPTIEVPRDLRLLPGKRGRRSNRTAEVVQRRWDIWRMQFESGIPIAAIARAWGCDHGSLCHAKRMNWKVGAYTRRQKK